MSFIRKLNNQVNVTGTNLRIIRTNSELSQQELCNKLALMGVDMYTSDIYEIENNKRLVKDFELKAFATIFNTSVDTFFKNTDKYFEH